MRNVRKIDGILSDYGKEIASGSAFLIDLDVAKAIIDLVSETFEFDEEGTGWDVVAFKAAMDYLSRSVATGSNRGKTYCIVRQEREIHRIRPGGRFQNAPDTKQEQQIAEELEPDTPLLMLFRQNGREELGWRDCPFWWPVLQVPRATKTTVFASEMVDQ